MDKTLGFISVLRRTSLTTIFESLYFTEDKVIALKVSKGGFMGYGTGNAISGWYKAGEEDDYLAKLSPEEALRLNEDGYVIALSDVTKVELKKWGLGARLSIATKEKRYSWFVRGLPGVKKPKLDDYENMLRRVFLEKLSVER